MFDAYRDTFHGRTVSHLLSSSLLPPHQQSALPLPGLHGATAGTREAVVDDDNEDDSGDDIIII